MEARLSRVERMERPVLERRRMSLELEGWRGSNKVLELVGVEKSFRGQPVLRGINATAAAWRTGWGDRTERCR